MKLESAEVPGEVPSWLEVATAEERPDLWARAEDSFGGVWPEYNNHGDHTGRYFEDGVYVFPGGLAPLDVIAGTGSYWEPNVWMRHDV
ncbi:MAG: hypothetical protein ACRDN0_26665 [Trebonia sp.]